MSGSSDYLIHIVARDLPDFERLHANVLGHLPGVARIESKFALREAIDRPLGADRMTSPGLTLSPGVFQVASAFPDPPFEVPPDSGFDIELIKAIAGVLGLTVRLSKFSGGDFNDIFDGLVSGRLDAVISGTTITPARGERVRFSTPYLEFNQGLAVNQERTPGATSTANLKGLTIGIQSGNTSDIVARKLLADGAIAGIKYYPYDGIVSALDDLTAGRIGAVIKLHPVIAWLVRDRPELAVVAEIPTHEELGIAFAKGNAALADAVDGALAALKADASFAALVARWFGKTGS